MYLTIQGIVLRVTDYNDRDALLTVLTRRHGRLTIKARGLRRKNSPLTAPCQLLAYGEFTLFEYRGQYTINEAHSIELFSPLRRELTKLSLATYFAQVAEVLSQEDLPNPELQSLLLNSLYALSNLDLPEAQIKSVFELRAACLSGYTPDLFGCHVRIPHGLICWQDSWNVKAAAARNPTGSGCRSRRQCWKPCDISVCVTPNGCFPLPLGGKHWHSWQI